MIRERKCPFRALESNKECGMTKGGMYIPMPEHVRMFCNSARYHQCRRFIKGCEMIKLKDEEGGEFWDCLDRRRLQRYPEQICLDLVVGDQESDRNELNSYRIKSLDVSLGGLRLESYKEFAKNTVVRFVLDPDVSSESLLGFGAVKWCKSNHASNKFEAGIAFTSFSASISIRKYLEL